MPANRENTIHTWKPKSDFPNPYEFFSDQSEDQSPPEPEWKTEEELAEQLLLTDPDILAYEHFEDYDLRALALDSAREQLARRAKAASPIQTETRAQVIPLHGPAVQPGNKQDLPIAQA